MLSGLTARTLPSLDSLYIVYQSSKEYFFKARSYFLHQADFNSLFIRDVRNHTFCTQRPCYEKLFIPFSQLSKFLGHNSKYNASRNINSCLHQTAIYNFRLCGVVITPFLASYSFVQDQNLEVSIWTSGGWLDQNEVFSISHPYIPPYPSPELCHENSCTEEIIWCKICTGIFSG